MPTSGSPGHERRAQGSALAALNGAPGGEGAIQELMQAVDSGIPAPRRATNLPFAMPIESVYNIQARPHPTAWRSAARRRPSAPEGHNARTAVQPAVHGGDLHA